MDEKKENYKQQTRLSFLQFLAEMPNFVVVTISALVTGSMIVWMDFVDSLGHFLRTITVLLLSKRLSKDLRYSYNYGVAKLEDIAVLFCDGIVMCGLVIATIMSVIQLIHPSQPSDLLLMVIGWKIITVIFDSFFFVGQYKIYKKENSIFAKSNLAAALAALLFDSVNFLSVLLVWLLNDFEWTWYLSPIISILIAFYLGYQCIKRVRKAISELSDKTLSEEEQMRILRAVTAHRNRAKLRFVKSHKVGDRSEIDIELSFHEDITYAEMLEIKTQLQEQISKDITDSSVNIYI